MAEKSKAVKAVVNDIEKAFGKGSIMLLDENEHEQVEVIPSGSLHLDQALGIGGYPKGRVIEVFGPESSGKTTLTLHAIANVQKAGGVAAFIDAEHARSLVEQAQTAERERDAAAKDAQAALDRKDMAAASQALSRLLELDPRHPAVPGLSAALNATFQQRAEEAQRAAAAARTEANAQAPNAPGFAEGDALLKEAQALLEKGEYAAATGRFAEARDTFGRAQRLAQQQAAERQRKEEAQRAAQQRAAQEAAAAAAAARAAAVPTAAPPISTATASAPASAPVAAANPQEAAVRQLMAQYESAMESRDIAQLRSVWPTIAAADQKKIETAFKSVKSWDVGLRVEAVEVSGPHAVVRAARQDTVNGTRTPAASQTFRLAQAADGWKIESIGQ